MLNIVGYASTFDTLNTIGYDEYRYFKVVGRWRIICFVNATTQEFAREFEVNPLQIDMLFIDADHARDAVLQDSQDFFPYVAPHGLILLHDTHPKDEFIMQPDWHGTAYQVAEIFGEEYHRVRINDYSCFARFNDL